MPRWREPKPPAPSPSFWPSPLSDSVARCLTDLVFRFRAEAGGTIRIAFQGRLMSPEVDISIREDRRRLGLQVAVPKSKEDELLRAVEVLNRTYCVAQLLFNENRRTIEAYHPVFLADLEPTPAFIWEQLRVVMHNHDVIHHTLADFLFNSYGPDCIERKARGFEEGLMMLWSQQEREEADEANDS
jgi:hypothetical protein